MSASSSSTSSSTAPSSSSSSRSINDTSPVIQPNFHDDGLNFSSVMSGLNQCVDHSLARGSYAPGMFPVTIYADLQDRLTAEPSLPQNEEREYTSYLVETAIINILATLPATANYIKTAAPKGYLFSTRAPFYDNAKINGASINDARNVISAVEAANNASNNNSTVRPYKGTQAVMAFFSSSDVNLIPTVAVGVLLSCRKKELETGNFKSIKAMHGTTLDEDRIRKIGMWAMKLVPNFAEQRMGIALINKYKFYKYHTTLTTTPGIVKNFWESVSDEFQAMIRVEDYQKACEDVMQPSVEVPDDRYSPRTLAVIYCVHSAAGTSWAPNPFKAIAPGVNAWRQGYKACATVGPTDIKSMLAGFKEYVARMVAVSGISTAKNAAELRGATAMLAGASANKLPQSSIAWLFDKTRQDADAKVLARNNTYNPVYALDADQE